MRSKESHAKVNILPRACGQCIELTPHFWTEPGEAGGPLPWSTGPQSTVKSLNQE